MTLSASHQNFYDADRGARSSWRLAVLMGKNVRTYKFALGRALLRQAQLGHAEIQLRDLAAAYAVAMAEHVTRAPQMSGAKPPSPSDFLTVAADEAEETLRAGRPTDRLLDAAVGSMPGMVMEKFHNLDKGEVGHRFYEVRGRGPGRTVLLTPDLLKVAASEQSAGLLTELEARWSIVESSFSTGVGRSLIQEGMRVDWDSGTLTDKRRRRSVAGVLEATIGFQHGRCHICDHVISPGDPVAIDHVFPFAAMARYPSFTLDLDALWNLSPAHESCNATKSSRMPEPWELMRLARRNTAIQGSPYPLSRTLQESLRTAGNRPFADWPEFLREVESLLH